MISLDLKPDTKTASKLVLPKDKPMSALSFASFLHTKQTQKEDPKLAQNGALVLSLQENNAADEKTKSTKNNSSSILSLLKSDDLQTLKEEVKSLELNPECIRVCTPFGLKEIPRKAVKGCKNPVHRMSRGRKSGLVIISVSPEYRVVGSHGFKVNPRFHGASVVGEDEQTMVKKIRT
ncbi:MAG: hypothetical protein P8Y16_01620 [Sulfurimonas sp.]